MIVTIHRNIVCSNFARNAIFLIGKPKNNRVTDKESKTFLTFVKDKTNYFNMVDTIIGRIMATTAYCAMLV